MTALVAATEPEAPVSSELLAILSQFSTHVQAIFEDLSRPPHVHPAPAAPAAASTSTLSTYNPSSDTLKAIHVLSQLDERLAAALHRAQKHERNQRRIEQLEQQLVDYELEWRSEMVMLEEQRVKLDKLVSAGGNSRDSIHKAKEAALRPSTVLAYARMLASYTSAPPKDKSTVGDAASAQSGSGGVPIGGILPYPTEEVMRRGRLAFAQVSEIGERAAVTGAKDEATKGARADQALANAPAAAAVRRPLAAVARQEPQEEEDFTFDLDLNPDL